MSELKSCPFCGGEACEAIGEQNGKPWPYIECIDCAAMGEPEIWNKRQSATPQPPRESLDKQVERQDDAAEARRFADAFIEIVNADHDDVISFNRDIGCRIRDHILSLRRAATPKEAAGVSEERDAVLEEAARHIEDGSAYSGYADVGKIHAQWIRSLKSAPPSGEQDHIVQSHGMVQGIPASLIGCKARGHVWHNYNAEMKQICIVCGAAPEPKPEAETPKE